MNQPASPAAPTAPVTGNILIVDDTPENLTVLRDILVRDGHKVRPAISGDLALRAAAAEAPDLILLDIMMPGIDGFETCRRLKADDKTRDVPVLFISALDAHDSKIQGFAVGALDYIMKPFRAEEVCARVRTHLSLRQAQVRLRRAHDELLEAARLREEVDAMLRHDLRGPLAGMIGYAELIAESPDREAADNARVITRAGYDLLGMIHASLDLLRMERGTYELKPEVFDAVEVVRQLTTELAPMAGRANISFDINAGDGLGDLSGEDDDCLVNGERLLARSLFSNLLKNAIEAAPKGSTISVRFRASAQESAEIRVKNPGAVPAAIRERFFGKFQTHGKSSGTGLGAYSAKLMATTQRGAIALDASEPGHTTIIVTLPRPGAADSARFRSAAAEKIRRETGRHTKTPPFPTVDILIADDDPANRALLKSFLPCPPLRLWFAAEGFEALAALRRNYLAVAILDLEMPGRDGLSIARVWRNETPPEAQTTVLIGLTAHTGPDLEARCQAAGFDRVLAKPVTRATLLAELHRILDPPPAVRLDPDIQALIPDFLASLPPLWLELTAAAAAGEHQRIRSLAHRLHGTLAMYGFTDASNLARAIETAGQDADSARAHTITADLRAHMARVDITYG